jgi:hypothetical protein
MAKKASKSARTTTKKGAKAGTKKDAAAFVDHLHANKEMRAILKKGWDDVVRAGKKKGFTFTRQELHDHLKKRYKVTSLNEEDEPDTCVCI